MVRKKRGRYCSIRRCGCSVPSGISNAAFARCWPIELRILTFEIVSKPSLDDVIDAPAAPPRPGPSSVQTGADQANRWDEEAPPRSSSSTMTERHERPGEGEFASFYAGYVSLVPRLTSWVCWSDRQPTFACRRSSLSRRGRSSVTAEGKWSVREMIGHVTDAERVFGFRRILLQPRR